MAAVRRDALLSPAAPWTRREGPRHVLHLDAASDTGLSFAQSVAAGLDRAPRTGSWSATPPTSASAPAT
jgi:hypothetical protein